MTIYFLFLPNCPVCDKLFPIISIIAAELKHEIVLCDASNSESHTLAIKNRVEKTPTLLFEVNNIIVGRAEGPGTYEEVKDKIANILK